MKLAEFFPVSTLITAIMMAGGAGWSSAAQLAQPQAVSSNTPSQTSTAVGHDQAGKDDPPNLVTVIMEVAKACIPAVVPIEVTERREVPNPFLPYQNDPVFRHFFSLPKKMPKKFKQERVGVGTGMIIDSQGHILTNNHVVGGASKMVVSLSDGTQHDATVVGTDPKTALAVIKISAKENLPFITFGDSISLCRVRQPAGAANGYAYRAPVPATRPATDYTARVIPHCPGVAVPLEAAQILWQR